MLYEKNLPKEFWAEAANIAVFLLNRLPTRVLEVKSPFEAWFDVKPILRNLKVFLAVCVFLIFHKSRETNWERKLNLGSLLATF